MNPILSVIIVCYNNTRLLFQCLDSIEKFHETAKYEVIVVAYLFTEENRVMLLNLFPWIIIIDSNEIRGFSENNNLALRQAKGNYLLILNDDTYFVNNMLDKLVDDFEQNEQISLLSPVLYNLDNSVQFNGRYKLTFFFWLLNQINLGHWIKSKYQNKSGLYQTYNISGACFAIRKHVMEKLGYFDEFIFFSPEDILLSSKANRNNYYCYVDTDLKIIHQMSKTAKTIYTVILPVARHGHYYYFRKEFSLFHGTLSRILTFKIALAKFIYWSLYPKKSERKTIMLNAHRNVAKYAFSPISPKALFIRLFNKIQEAKK